MADLPETAVWEDGVYQKETTDPVVGGENGVSNRAEKELANRTAYLKKEIEDHADADDPHTQYLTKTEGDELYKTVPVPNASVTIKGKVELATGAEALAGRDNSRAVTPQGLATKMAAHEGAADPHSQYTVLPATEQVAGKIQIATLEEASRDKGRIDRTKAITPATLQANLRRYRDRYDLSTTVDSKIQAATTIPGSIIIWPLETPPTGYFECNGDPISRTTYAVLFKVIGIKYGAGNGSTTFNLPDLRGQFVRGWDHGHGDDPDAATRTDRGDGTTGDKPGTKQSDQYKAHIHTETGGVRWPSTGTGVGSGRVIAHQANKFTGSSGGQETRPKNISMMFCIKT